MFGIIIQRGITWKLRKREQSFLCTAHRHDPIHIPIKLHEDTPTITDLWCVQECLEKINQKGITWKQRNGKQSFLCVTRVLS